MKLLNYRLGFAANSSSLHSTWHVEDIQDIQDEIESMQFEWNAFVCSSKENIRRYLASQYIANIIDIIPDEIIFFIINNLFSEISEDEYYQYDEYIDEKRITALVDHQSLLTLPHDYITKNKHFPSIKFLKDIEEYLIRTKSVIIGGNDNEDLVNIDDIIPQHQKRHSEFYLNHLTEIGETKNVVCLKDGKVWKVFNQNNGEKIRFSFEDNVRYDKSDTPELVDLIITNKCHMGCPYCYRGCTPSGKHADIGFVKDIIRSLENKNLHVFEVAIGGGDILEYPQLGELCAYISYNKENKIVFNTTLNCQSFTIENFERIKLVLNSFTGIAISVKSIEDIQSVITYTRRCFDVNSKWRISFQCIPELMSYDELRKIIDKGGNNITFLGFKHTGRGSSSEFSAAAGFEENKKPFRKIVQDIHKKHLFCRWFGVDTELLKNFPELKKTQAEWAYTEGEGKFSCCIDAVDGYVLPSSYSEYKDEYKFPDKIQFFQLDDFILEQFQKF